MSDEVYGVINRRLDLIAKAHLARQSRAGAVSEAELGLSVRPKARGRDMGRRLFDLLSHVDAVLEDHAADLDFQIKRLAVRRHASQPTRQAPPGASSVQRPCWTMSQGRYPARHRARHVARPRLRGSATLHHVKNPCLGDRQSGASG